MNKTTNRKVECIHCNHYLGNLHLNERDNGHENIVFVPYKKQGKMTKITAFTKVEDTKTWFARKKVKRVVAVTDVRIVCSRCHGNSTLSLVKELEV